MIFNLHNWNRWAGPTRLGVVTGILGGLAAIIGGMMLVLGWILSDEELRIEALPGYIPEPQYLDSPGRISAIALEVEILITNTHKESVKVVALPFRYEGENFTVVSVDAPTVAVLQRGQGVERVLKGSYGELPVYLAPESPTMLRVRYRLAAFQNGGIVSFSPGRVREADLRLLKIFDQSEKGFNGSVTFDLMPGYLVRGRERSSKQSITQVFQFMVMADGESYDIKRPVRRGEVVGERLPHVQLVMSYHAQDLSSQIRNHYRSLTTDELLDLAVRHPTDFGIVTYAYEALYEDFRYEEARALIEGFEPQTEAQRYGKLNNLGAWHLVHGVKETGLAMLQDAVAIDPHGIWAPTNILEYYYLNRQALEITWAARRFLDMEPVVPFGFIDHLCRAQIALKVESDLPSESFVEIVEGNIPYFKDYLRQEPYDAYINSCLGNSYLELRQYADAARYLRIAYNNGYDTDRTVLNNLSASYANLHTYEDALKFASITIELYPEHYFAYYNRGYALWKLNRIEEAVHSYLQCLERKPDFEHAARELSALLLETRQFELHDEVFGTTMMESSNGTLD